MSKPNSAFQTLTHTVYALDTPGEYRAEPGGIPINLSLDSQQLPAELVTPEFERVVMAWVMARGGRALNLNGLRREIAPEHLDRPARREPARVVSIAPSNAEIVGALGAVDMLVGVESSSDFPPEVNQLPRLGSDLNVEMDKLAALKPDLVLASLTVPGMERNIAALDGLGIPMLVLAPRTLLEIHTSITRVGQALGRADAAAQVTTEMALRERAFRTNRQRPMRVYLEWWPKPMFSPAEACWSNELIELAGGENVFRDMPGQSGQVSPEQVVEADPEVIFVSWCGVPKNKLDPGNVLARERLADVSAVRNGRVYTIDESLLGRPGPRVLDGVARMAEAISGM